jgi:hypothetical protein
VRRGDRALVFTPEELRAEERDTQAWIQFETKEYILDKKVRAGALDAVLTAL